MADVLKHRAGNKKDLILTGNLLIAGAIVLVMLCIREYNHYRAEPAIQTQYGEIKTAQLPDGTEVMLNAHSSLAFNKNYGNGNIREVWIKGEVYFNMRQTHNNSRFIVHTAKYTISGVTAKFNVVSRGNACSVLLQEGSAAIRPDKMNAGRETLLQPNDFVTVNNHIVQRQLDSSQLVVAWKERKVSWTNAGIPEVAAFIEGYYGTKVTLLKDGSLPKKITGLLPNNSLPVLLHALEAATGLKFTAKYNEVVISAG